MICIFLILLIVGCTSTDEPIVARVGDETITAEEFRQRYTAYLAEVSQRDNIVLRQKILMNMIHEMLIMRDIARQGFDRDSQYQRKMEEIHDQALLDGYARHISIDTMRVSEGELWNEFRAFNSRASARYLYGRTEADAWRLKEHLARGATFEDLARKVFEDPGLATNGGYLGSFGWGEMEQALDEAVFSLPLGIVSDPIRLSVGYAIVKVETRFTNPLASQGDYLKNRDKLARAVHERKVVRLVTEDTRRIAGDLAPVYNDEALTHVLGVWNSSARSLLPDAEFEESRLEIPREISGMPMVSFRDRSWTVAEFSLRLAATTEKQRKRVRSVDDLKEFVLGLATREVLMDRARVAGLERDSMVIEHIQKGRLAYLLKRWGMSVTDTTGASGWPEAVIQKTYARKSSEYTYPPEVNVAEILVRTKDEADALLQQVQGGADFAELARIHSIRLWAAKRGGELGFGTRAGYGILAEKIFSSHVGQVVGPERVDPYYGVFKILAKKEGRPKSLEEAREEIIKELSYNGKQVVSRRAVEQLTAGVPIAVDNEALAHVVLNEESS